jgi:hypothetical protein
LSQLGVPHTQNFEIPLKNSRVKKFKKSFLKILIKWLKEMAQILVKVTFWEALFKTFYRFGKF